MKILTLNFLTCAVKACKSSPASFPLHIQDAELESMEIEFNDAFIRNVLPRVEWEALRSIAGELGLTLPSLTSTDPNPSATTTVDASDAEAMDITISRPTSSLPTITSTAPDPSTLTEDDVHKLHSLLLETQIVSGKLVCGNCGHEYAVREGIANFLLPAHLV